jgi:hypothetical protein
MEGSCLWVAGSTAETSLVQREATLEASMSKGSDNSLVQNEYLLIS